MVDDGGSSEEEPRDRDSPESDWLELAEDGGEGVGDGVEIGDPQVTFMDP